MMSALPKPVRQAIAVLLLILSAATLWFITVAPLSANLGELQDRIEQERLMLGRLTAAANEDPGDNETKQRALSARMSSLFIQGESESIRVSSVQSQLMEILNKNRVKPRSSRNLAARERNGFRVVGVQLQLSAPIEQLQAVLLDIEQNKPLLMIEGLHITPNMLSGMAGDEERGMLEARLDVFGIEAKQKGQ
jgi:Type II secretion system (T2SS), protein M subtype b